MKTSKELNKIALEKYGVEDLFYFIDGEDEEFCEETEALSILLKDEIVWPGQYKDKEISDKVFCKLFVNTNDVMMWACSDCEELEFDQIIPLVKLYLDNKRWGAVKWSCLPNVNNMQPQYPMKRDMKKEGYWDEELESLPKNIYDNHKKKSLLVRFYSHTIKILKEGV